MSQTVVLAGNWLCLSCFLWFSWDSYHEKAVYAITDLKTHKTTKVETPLCGNGTGPCRCPACGKTDLECCND